MGQWQALGFALYDGPEPTTQAFAARERTAVELCQLSLKTSWSLPDKALAGSAIQHFREAAAACISGLPDVLRERRRLRAGKLPLWKELGREALEVLHNQIPGQDAWLLTQWSNILSPPQLSPRDSTMTRTVAGLAEGH